MPAKMRKWSPLGEMVSMQRDLDRMFHEFMGREPFAWWRREGTWEAPAELVETKDAMLLSIELPGVEAKDVDISLHEGAVVIKGEKRSAERTDAEVHLAERYFGPFERRIELPAPAVPDGVRATLANGVLALAIPRREEAKRRAIPVTTG